MPSALLSLVLLTTPMLSPLAEPAGRSARRSISAMPVS